MLCEHVINAMQQTVSFRPFLEGKLRVDVSRVIGGSYVGLKGFHVH